MPNDMPAQIVPAAAAGRCPIEVVVAAMARGYTHPEQSGKRPEQIDSNCCPHGTGSYRTARSCTAGPRASGPPTVVDLVATSANARIADKAATGGHFRVWHLPDVCRLRGNVRFRGKSGHQLEAQRCLEMTRSGDRRPAQNENGLSSSWRPRAKISSASGRSQTISSRFLSGSWK